MSGRHWEQNKEATVYVGNLDERFTEPLLWELMTHMGPVVNVHMPMDRVSRQHQGFGFVEFDTAESADYAVRCLHGIRLYGKPARVNKASADRQRATDIGAELFVNGLDPQVDEKILYDTFTQFGRLVAPPTVVRDPATNASKGYGFVNFDSFEASDAARDALHGQYLLNRQIAVEYAYKKDGKGERHGDAAERKLAAEGKKHNVMPDIQPLPPAFLMDSRALPTPPPLSVTGSNTLPVAPNNAALPLQQQQQQQPLHHQQQSPHPLSSGPNGTGAGPFVHPQRQMQQLQQQQQAPPYAPGAGLAGSPTTASAPYGMAPPNGLPTRLPPGPPGFHGAPYLQPQQQQLLQQQQMPPPSFGAGANGMAPMMPPSGAPGALPGQGYGGMMPPPPPPAGFGR